MSMTDYTEPLQIAPDPETLHTFHRQQLSAMLDGELSPDEAKFMLRRLEHDVELSRCWERWQICGEVLRGRAEGLLSGDFAARVAVAVQAPSPRVQAGRKVSRHSSRLMTWGGGGIAASLALAAVLVVNLHGNVSMPDSVAKLAEEVSTAASLSEGPVERLSGKEVVVAAPGHSPPAARELLAPAEVAASALPRPWPRAGVGAGAFNVGYGAASDPFRPRWSSPISAFGSGAEIYPVPVQADTGRDRFRMH